MFPQSKSGLATSCIPKEEWSMFVKEFGQSHQGWSTTLETTDHVTQETVESPDMPLQSMELNLEDEKNPRINVVVGLGNKTLQHILFKPSRVLLHASLDEESLEVETINTTTQVHVRPQGNSFVVV